MSSDPFYGDLDFFVDLQPQSEDFMQAALEGLSLQKKRIPSKFFYDEAGSNLFDLICDTPEYYITRTEVSILSSLTDEIPQYVGPNCNVVEYGCGSSKKIEALLTVLPSPTRYIPIDISKEHLISTAKEITSMFPEIKVGAICADFSLPLDWPEEFLIKSNSRLGFFPGSTIGNQSAEEVKVFLGYVRRMLGKGGKFLIGVDTKKDIDILNRAYNDEEGHTSKFNLNLLRRMEVELGAELNLSGFYHHAEYNPALGCMEMYLVSDIEQKIRLNDKDFSFEAGERIHTENSYKYTKNEFCALANGAGYELLSAWSDDKDLFAIYLFEIV